MLRFPSAALLLALFLSLTACESQLDEPAAMTPATRGALDVLPAEAQFVGMADLRAMERRGVGPHAGGAAPDRLTGEVGARLRHFFQATGFDLREDLREAYIAVPEDGAPSLAVYADFSEERMAQYLREEAGDKLSASAYRGVSVYEHAPAEADEQPVALALVNGDLVLASPEAASVRAMIDRLSGRGTAALSSDAEALRLIEQVQGRGDAWAVMRGTAGHFLQAADASSGDGPAARLSRAVRDAAISLRFAEDGGVSGQAFLTAEDGIATGDLAAVVRGLVATQKASAAGDRAALQTLDNVQVDERGEQVRIRFDEPAGAQR